MEPRTSREKLVLFLESLPDSVHSALLDRKIVVDLLTIDIAAAQGLILNETGAICEGVRRVLSGEDSPANLVAFISEDERIEEDNRGKIPAIAYEIQTKIFDPVLPILKQAGMPVKEGRVATPAVSVEWLAVSKEGREQILVPQRPPVTPTVSPSPSELNAKRSPPSGGLNAPLDERHLRALLRIAAGTTYTEERLREAFEDLPPGLRQAITSVDTANAVQEIAKKYLLHVDQMAALASETGLVLLGLTHPRNFVKNLASRLRISEARALEIAREISGQILSKVREALRGLHETPTTPEPPPLKGGEEKPRTVEMPKRQDVLAAQEEQPPKTTPFGKGVTTPAPPKRDTPFGKGVTTPVPPKRDTPFGKGDTELNAKRYPLDASLNTPYSPEARWNLEAARGVHETAERINRDELLRSIEQPKEASSPPTGGLTASSVPPTKTRPASEPTPLHPPSSEGERKEGKEDPEDFVAQKLRAPISLPKEEKRYTIDPYREPLG